MKITKEYLKQVIREEYNLMLLEENSKLEEGPFLRKATGALAGLAFGAMTPSDAAAKDFTSQAAAQKYAKSNTGPINVSWQEKAKGRRGAIVKGTQIKSPFVNTGLLDKFEIKSGEDLYDVDNEDKLKLLKAYLDIYQDNPKFNEYLSKNKKEAFAGTIGQIGVDNALEMLADEYEKDLENEGNQQLMYSALGLLNYFVNIDLGSEEL